MELAINMGKQTLLRNLLLLLVLWIKQGISNDLDTAATPVVMWHGMGNE